MNSSQDETYDVEPGQSYQVDLFRPEDAQGVARLFLTVYGRGYPFKAFIEPDVLIEENAAGRIISSVVRTEKGDIVGHNALYNIAPSEGVKESGAGLVHPLYRGGKGLFKDLALHGQDMAAGRTDMDGIYGEPVTNHPYAQKMVYSINWKITALEAALMPAAAYAQEHSAAGRVSCFCCFKTLRPYHHAVCLPDIYEPALKYMYTNLEDTRQFQISEQDLPDTDTAIDSRIFDFAQVARMTVWRAGRDLGSVLDRHERDSLEKGVQTIQVWLNLSWPWCGAATETLRGRGYFLGGLLPRWYGEDALLMQKTLTAPAWDQIQIGVDGIQEIKDYVAADWAAVQER